MNQAGSTAVPSYSFVSRHLPGHAEQPVFVEYVPVGGRHRAGPRGGSPGADKVRLGAVVVLVLPVQAVHVALLHELCETGHDIICILERHHGLSHKKGPQ